MHIVGVALFRCFDPALYYYKAVLFCHVKFLSNLLYYWHV